MVQSVLLLLKSGDDANDCRQTEWNEKFYRSHDLVYGLLATVRYRMLPTIFLQIFPGLSNEMEWGRLLGMALWF